METANNSSKVRLQQLRYIPDYSSMDTSSSSINTAPTSRTQSDGRLNYGKTTFYGNPVATCSRKQAFVITAVVLITLIICSFIIAFVRPKQHCSDHDEDHHFSDHFHVPEPTTTPTPYATNGEKFPWEDVRLPDSLVPLHYSIRIHPNMTTLSLKGKVEVMFNVVKNTNFIVLHGKNLTLSVTLVVDDQQKEVLTRKILYYPYHQQVYIELHSELQAGANYSLTILYEGKIRTDLEGLYLSSYTTPAGVKRYLVTTHFQPTFARSAFPCWDEPHFKAKFKMSIIRPRDYISLSNMPLESKEDVGNSWGTGLVQDNFVDSVPMSTYLVALVVCDYNHVKNVTRSGITLTVHSPPHMIDQAQFALSVASQLLDYYEDFFGIPYPLPKLDLIGIPDFASGAMENWGLSIFRESTLLIYANQSSSSAKSAVAVIVAHELAHQWFGNLVTMRWWNDLWLNEGFASFIQYLGVASVFPDWSMMDQLVLKKTQSALETDALSTSHPITLAVSDPSDIESIFDAISYSKGAAILYMLQRVLGEDMMRRGLNLYLEQHKYQTSSTDDLWQALTTASHNSSHVVDVKTMMTSWTNQVGFPLITLRRTDNLIHASQERFLLLNSSSKAAETNETKWYVPLSYATAADPKLEHQIWMRGKDMTFRVAANGSAWIKANVNQTGFYRVNYDASLWNALSKALSTQHNLFSPADKAQLLDDAFTLNRAGLINASIPLTLSQYLKDETAYLPWSTALQHLRKLDTLLMLRSSRRSLHCYARHLLTPLYGSLGWNNRSSHVHSLLQREMLEAAIYFGLSSAVDEAKRQFQLLMTRAVQPNPDVRDIVYLTGVKYGGWNEWSFCWQKYKETNVPAEKVAYLKALAESPDPWILQQYLDLTLDRNLVRPQDVRVVVESVARNPVGSLLIWRQFQTRWPVLEQTFGRGSFIMGRLIVAAVSQFSSRQDLKSVESFFRNVDVGAGRRSLQQSLEMIQSNIQFVDKYQDEIAAWLAKYAPRC